MQDQDDRRYTYMKKMIIINFMPYEVEKNKQSTSLL